MMYYHTTASSLVRHTVSSIVSLLLQASVKEVLYEGLIRTAISDPAVSDNILDFLWPHFQNYYSEVTLPDRLFFSVYVFVLWALSPLARSLGLG
jgi:hypothetical protein